jgi:hypothetical protein
MIKMIHWSSPEMSDVNTTPSPHTNKGRPRGPAKRPRIWIDGIEWQARDELSDEVGFSHRTGARKFKENVRYIACIAYVPREANLRELVGPVNEPQPKPRTTRRGPYRKSGK